MSVDNVFQSSQIRALQRDVLIRTFASDNASGHILVGLLATDLYSESLTLVNTKC